VADTKEYRFRIDAYTPETMPMARLAEYLAELALVLGEERAVHFARLEPGSTTVVNKIEVEAIPKVRSRAAAVRRGDAPPDAMRGYRRINKLLREDNGVGTLQEDGAEIIRFPGREEAEEKYGTITQQGTLDGEVIRVGGQNKHVPVILQSEDRIIANCWASRTLAKALGVRLFEPVRLYGSGRWGREDGGIWRLEYFRIDRFEPLKDESLSSVIGALRSMGGEWSENVLDVLKTIRHGPSEKPNGGV